MTSTHNNSLIQDPFFASNQKYLSWFAFFSVFPLVKIAGISITFFIFLIIAYKFLKRKKKLFKITQWTDIFLILFLLFIFIAASLTEESYREWTAFSIIKLTTQYFYWVVLALFVKTWIYDFDFYKLSRTIFFAAVISIIYYVTLNPFYLVFYQNSFAYVVVTAMPLAYYYVMKRFSIPITLFISTGFFMGVLFSGSRTGTALIVFELMLLLSLGSKQLKKASMIIGVSLIPIVLVLFISIDQSNIKQIKLGMADVLEDYSPKIAHTLRMKESVLDRDKSFLIRKLMIQKGEKIFEEHPFFGVGPGNFTRYYTSLDIREVSSWLHGTEKNYNRRSSQNTYLLIIAEDGIFALVSILIVFVVIVWKGFYYVKSFRNNTEIYIYIPFIALLFYGVILGTIQGALFWLLLGLALTLTQRKRHLA